MVHRMPFSLRALSFPRWLNNTRWILHRWLRQWRGLVGREALSRVYRRRSIVLGLEGLEERLVPASAQDALTLPSLLRADLATTAFSLLLRR